jgi:hypothetical protein
MNGAGALYDAASNVWVLKMKPALFSAFLLMLCLPLVALAGDLHYDCSGKRRFEHRGAASTVPADARHRYVVQSQKMEGLDCKLSDELIACMGLTPEKAMRKVVIDRVAATVSDTLEMPTSLLIFEGRCQ